jgi:hypothetical protein
MSNDTPRGPGFVESNRLSTLLESIPPGQEARVRVEFDGVLKYNARLKWPTVTLWCNQPTCERSMQCDATVIHVGDVRDVGYTACSVAKYLCRNCKSELKTFALQLTVTHEAAAKVVKLGEWPVFRPHVPDSVRSLMGSDWQIFLQGRQAEGLGLGIGAFAYYRRVVDSRKNQLIDQIIKVAERVGESPELVNALSAAKAETQFKKAMESVRVPQSILIDGDNPLTLLYAAISEGLHAKSDGECLDAARAVRVLIVELVRRIDLALDAHDEIKSAISDLNALRAKRNQGGSTKDATPKTP